MPDLGQGSYRPDAADPKPVSHSLASLGFRFDIPLMESLSRISAVDIEPSAWQPRPIPIDLQALGDVLYGTLSLHQTMFVYFLALLGIMVIIWVVAENDELGLGDKKESNEAAPEADNVHPIRKESRVDVALLAIREYWTGGAVPRIVVDAEHPQVQVPPAVKERWRNQLVIDLDPAYPLRLELQVAGLWADLSFSGEVYRCFFAWEAIYSVQNRETGATQVFEHRVPKKMAS